MCQRLVKSARGQIFGVGRIARAVVDVGVDPIYMPLVQLSKRLRVTLRQLDQRNFGEAGEWTCRHPFCHLTLRTWHKLEHP